MSHYSKLERTVSYLLSPLLMFLMLLGALNANNTFGVVLYYSLGLITAFALGIVLSDARTEYYERQMTSQRG